MIKKISAVICIFALCVLLCGCGGVYELSDRYTVTALGFDGGDLITVTAEFFSTGDSVDTELIRSVVSAEGKDVRSAFYNLELKLSEIPVLDHCTAVVIGDGIESDNLKEVFKFCKDKSGLNYGVNFSAAKSAEKLLSAEPYNIAIGFDIVNAISNFKEISGFDFNSRGYEIEADLSQSGGSFKLPFFDFGQKGVNIVNVQRFIDCKKTDTSDTMFSSFLSGKRNGERK